MIFGLCGSEKTQRLSYKQRTDPRTSSGSFAAGWRGLREKRRLRQPKRCRVHCRETGNYAVVVAPSR